MRMRINILITFVTAVGVWWLPYIFTSPVSHFYCYHISHNKSQDKVHWLGLEAGGRREPETPYLTLEWVRLSCRLWRPWESCCSSTERGRLVLEAWVLLAGADGAAMPISRSNKLGFCGATIGGSREGEMPDTWKL